MIMMLFRSVRLGTRLFHQLGEAVEEVANVVRAGARFGMPLKTERGPIRPCQSLEGTVEERDVRGSQGLRDRFGIHSKTVVLARYHDAAGIEVLHRVVCAVVAELHLARLRARGEAHQL